MEATDGQPGSMSSYRKSAAAAREYLHRAALSSGKSLALMMLMLALCIFCASATYSGIEIVWRRHLRALLGDSQKAPSARALRSQRTAGVILVGTRSRRR